MAKEAKKEVKDPVAKAAGEKLAEARAKREAARAKDRLVYKGESEKKLAPQAQVIVNAVKAAGKRGLSRAELNEALTGVLVTRQPVGRIVTYYQKSLVDAGCIEIIEEAPAKT